MLLDTQIISYYFKEERKDEIISSCGISSITANEFLLAQAAPGKNPDYYILHPVIFGHLAQAEAGLVKSEHFKNPKWAKGGKRRTDQVIIDFNGMMPAYREFGNVAISEVINQKLGPLYLLCVQHLPKEKQKYLKKRIQYIFTQDISCYPLDKIICETALNLLSVFVEQYSAKENFRNTINDMLIASTAIRHRMELVTEDNLLSRFLADFYEAKTRKGDVGLILDFTEKQVINSRKCRESKGYINKGWSFAMNNHRDVSGA